MCADDGTTFSPDSRGHHHGSVNFKRSPARFLFCLRPLFNKAHFLLASSYISSASRPSRSATGRICHPNSPGSILAGSAIENLAVFLLPNSSASWLPERGVHSTWTFKARAFICDASSMSTALAG